MKTAQFIAFSNLSASFGGAVSVEYSARVARITLPGRDKPVRVLRSQLPADPDTWNNFKLADLCQNLK